MLINSDDNLPFQADPESFHLGDSVGMSPAAQKAGLAWL